MTISRSVLCKILRWPPINDDTPNDPYYTPNDPYYTPNDPYYTAAHTFMIYALFILVKY